MKNYLGRHMLVEFYNCNPDALDDVALVEQEMNHAARECGATIVQSSFHRFEPYGVSGVVVIAESHLAIHTWPEYRYASVDLYTCGGDIDPMVAYNVLKEKLGARTAEIQKINRGNLDMILARLSRMGQVHPAAAQQKSLMQVGGARP
jgi:S-adenosylmethionine decarboxylase proenzyme